MYIFKAQNLPLENHSAMHNKYLLCGDLLTQASLPDGSLPDNILSVFIEGNFKVISCLCL